MRSGVSGARAPRAGPSGARYTVVRRVGSARTGSVAVVSGAGGAGLRAAPLSGPPGAKPRGLGRFGDQLEVVLAHEPVAPHVHPTVAGVDPAEQKPLRELRDERAGGRTAQVFLGGAGDGEVVAVAVGRADRRREDPTLHRHGGPVVLDGADEDRPARQAGQPLAARRLVEPGAVVGDAPALLRHDGGGHADPQRNWNEAQGAATL